MVWLAQWHVEGNAPKDAIFYLEKTALAYKRHLTEFAKDKLLFFEITDLEKLFQ